MLGRRPAATSSSSAAHRAPCGVDDLHAVLDRDALGLGVEVDRDALAAQARDEPVDELGLVARQHARAAAGARSRWCRGGGTPARARSRSARRRRSSATPARARAPTRSRSSGSPPPRAPRSAARPAASPCTAGCAWPRAPRRRRARRAGRSASRRGRCAGRAPCARKRSGSSSVAAIAACTARTRSNTFAVSIRGSTGSIPNSPAVRMWCATLAEASSAFEGTQPVHRQSPPTRLRSITATLTPSVAANSAATMPPEPMPTMIRSWPAMRRRPYPRGKLWPCSTASGPRCSSGSPGSSATTRASTSPPTATSTRTRCAAAWRRCSTR